MTSSWAITRLKCEFYLMKVSLLLVPGQLKECFYYELFKRVKFYVNNSLWPWKKELNEHMVFRNQAKAQKSNTTLKRGRILRMPASWVIFSFFYTSLIQAQDVGNPPLPVLNTESSSSAQCLASVHCSDQSRYFKQLLINF